MPAKEPLDGLAVESGSHQLTHPPSHRSEAKMPLREPLVVSRLRSGVASWEWRTLGLVLECRTCPILHAGRKQHNWTQRIQYCHIQHELHLQSST